MMPHRSHNSMRYRFGIIPVIFALQVAVATCQTSSPATVSAQLQPALSDVQSSTAALNISKWKAPGSVRDAAQQNVDSIQRDLGSTLPGLLSQADAAPAAVPPAFAVYRNVDALYDVLLRVCETADLAASPDEAASIASGLEKLQSARAQLGDQIMLSSQKRESQIASLSAASKAQATTPAKKSETVIDDGPESSAAKKARKKSSTKKPASPPADTSANPSN
jgi:hypothetical protein